MQSLKATLIFSLTTLILLASYIAYNSHQDRFTLLPIQADKSIYVFDRKNNTLNYCTSDSQCKLIKLNMPAEHESKGSMLPASLLSILDSKNQKGKEATSTKKVADTKAAVTVAATRAVSTAKAPAKKPALTAAEVHTPAQPASAQVVPAMPMPAAAASPAPMMAPSPVPIAPTPTAIIPTPAPAPVPTNDLPQAATPAAP